MDKIPTGVIRKIVLGTNPKDGLSFSIGQEIQKVGSGNKISLILEDENNYHRFGVVRYWIFFKTEKGEEVLWKSFSGVSVTIEYDINDKSKFI